MRNLKSRRPSPALVVFVSRCRWRSVARATPRSRSPPTASARSRSRRTPSHGEGEERVVAPGRLRRGPGAHWRRGAGATGALREPEVPRATRAGKGDEADKGDKGDPGVGGTDVVVRESAPAAVAASAIVSARRAVPSRRARDRRRVRRRRSRRVRHDRPGQSADRCRRSPERLDGEGQQRDPARRQRPAEHGRRQGDVRRAVSAIRDIPHGACARTRDSRWTVARRPASRCGSPVSRKMDQS